MRNHHFFGFINGLPVWGIFLLVFTLIGCSSTQKHIDIHCHHLSYYHNGIETIDPRTLKYVSLDDSIQYREYLLGFSDSSDSLVVSGVAFLEKCYKFDAGLVLIMNMDSIKYEVIVIAPQNSFETKRIIANRYYMVKLKPYFIQKGYASERRKYIYLEHYVIMPAYILRDERRIYTAQLTDIVACNNTMRQ